MILISAAYGCYEIAGYSDLVIADPIDGTGGDGGGVLDRCLSDDDCQVSECQSRACVNDSCEYAPIRKGIPCGYLAQRCDGLGSCNRLSAHLWSKLYGDSAYQVATSVDTWGDESLVIGGQIKGTVDFGDSQGLQEASEQGFGDGFVAMLNADGDGLWSRVFGVTGYQMVRSVHLDEGGNVLLGGEFEGSFDAGVPAFSTSGKDAFLIKLTASGDHLFTAVTGGLDEQKVVDIETDGSDILITGQFEDTIFDEGHQLVSNGLSDVFVARLDGDGAVERARGFGDKDAKQMASAIAVDSSGNVVVTGSFVGTMVFDDDIELTSTDSSSGQSDIFIAMLNPNLDTLWALPFGDELVQQAHDVAIDSGNNIIVVGEMAGSIDFGGKVLSSTGSSVDVFVVKISPTREVIFAERYGGDGIQRANSVYVDQANNIYLTGSFSQEIDFGGGEMQSVLGHDIFVAGFDPMGEYLFAYRFGDENEQFSTGITGDSSNVILTGLIYGETSLGGPILSTAGNADIFVAKYDRKELAGL